jgi:hypothetical protein
VLEVVGSINTQVQLIERFVMAHLVNNQNGQVVVILAKLQSRMIHVSLPWEQLSFYQYCVITLRI